MKKSSVITIALSLLLTCMALPLAAHDMRALQIEARQAKQELSKKARQEKTEAQEAAAESRQRITSDKDSLEQEIDRISSLNEHLSEDVEQLAKTSEELAQKEKELNDRLENVDAMVQELIGVIRSNARDMNGLVEQNGQTGFAQGNYSFLARLAEDTKFPAMEDVRSLHTAVLEQIQLTGEVSLQSGTIINRAGLETAAEVLFVGPFTAVYRSGEETGFLNYSSAGNKLYALNHLPPRHMRNEINLYMEGEQDGVPVDISRGAALRQLSYQQSLVDQIASGGPVVWPILGLLVVGLLIVLERVFTLWRNHHKKIPVFDKIKTRIQKNDWQGCAQECQALNQKPIARVLLAGIRSHELPREDIENVLQEAILREIPVLERFLSTLGMLVAIAPLLGLLGTVTGMINVFHVITLNGTGDPRLMSGGISEALVTTMLGLGVAIPLMLLHNVLNRTVDRIIAEMEEKSVALVNLIHKQRNPA